MTNSVAGPSKKPKLGGYDFYRSIGSPKWVVAPMVDQSELAWRMLSRSPLPTSMAGPSTAPTTEVPYPRHPGGATLCYTPMIHAKVFSDSKQISKGGDGQFNLTQSEEGSSEPVAGIEGGDRPLFVQFCANDPQILLSAAKKLEHRCDAVDINFGCPQGIAKRGNYGSFLQDDWELIKSLIGTLHENLSVPVTAKFRVFPDKARTVAYAKMMEAAGAQIITCHGRTREMKGQFTGLADWELIKAVKEAVSIPVFANGNILYREDVDRCLELTGCDGVMSAEGNLSNPALFLPPDHPHFHPHIATLADRYLDMVDGLKTPTAMSAVRAHFFRMLKPVLDEHEHIRQMIANARTVDGSITGGFREVVQAVRELVQTKVDEAGPGWTVPPIDPITGYRSLPNFVVQPYIRPTTVITGDEITSAVNLTEEVGETPSIARPGSPTSMHSNVVSNCVSVDPSPCSASAALRCPTRACLVHCRQIRAVANGMDPQEAAHKVKTGELNGMGCESHEAKFIAKKEAANQKRKYRNEARQLHKIRKSEAKQTLRAAREGEQAEQAENTDTVTA